MPSSSAGVLSFYDEERSTIKLKPMHVIILAILIGGAVIRAGDWVVDGSVKAQLEQLVSTLGS